MTALKDMRILITGVQGQVGFELIKSLGNTGADLILAARRSTAINSLGYKTVTLDLADEQQIRSTIREIKPHIVINAAAYTAVDQAEREADLARRINCEAVRALAEELKALQGALIHFSTDYVYHPQHSDLIHEDDEQHPSGVYARTKAAGDQALIKADIPFIILRTSWVYGINGNNFVKTMLKLGAERETLRVVADQFGAPTSALTLAQAVRHILGRDPSNPLKVLKDRSGVYNISDRGNASWHLFAQEIFSFARTIGFNLRIGQVDAISSAEFPSPVARPKNSRLSLEKLEKTFDFYPPDWKNSLHTFLFQAQLGLVKP